MSSGSYDKGRDREHCCEGFKPFMRKQEQTESLDVGSHPLRSPLQIFSCPKSRVQDYSTELQRLLVAHLKHSMLRKLLLNEHFNYEKNVKKD